jgi:hypothetical protein
MVRWLLSLGVPGSCCIPTKTHVPQFEKQGFQVIFPVLERKAVAKKFYLIILVDSMQQGFDALLC